MIIKRIPDKTADKKASEQKRVTAAVIGGDKTGVSYVSSRLLRDGLLGSDTPAGLRTLVELGKPYFYFALGMDKRFEGREFYSISSKEKFKTNIELGYNWYIKRSFEENVNSFRMISSAPGDLVIFDCSGLLNDEKLYEILCEVDIIYLVVDPMPSSLLENVESVALVRRKFPNCKLVVNKFDKGIHRAELNAFLGTSNYFSYEALPLENFYKAEYNCTLV